MRKALYLLIFLAALFLLSTIFIPNIKGEIKYVLEEPLVFAGDKSFAPFSFFPEVSLDKSSAITKTKDKVNLPPQAGVRSLVSDIPSGYCIDLMKAVSGITKEDIRIKLMSWEKCISELKAGNINGIIGIPVYGKREPYLDYSKPIAKIDYAIFVDVDNRFVNSMESLEGTVVAVQKESLIEKKLSDEKRIQLLITESIPEALDKLKNREVTAVIAERDTALYYIQRNKMFNFKIVGPPVGPVYDYALAVREGETKLLDSINHGITILEGNGTLTRLKRKWLGLDLRLVEPFPFKRFVIITSGITAIMLVLLGMLWTISLNITVKRKTQQIQLMSHKMAEKDKLAVLGTLAGQIAHELRTPLSVINNSVFLLRKEGPTNKELFEKRLVVLEDKARLTSNILESILSYSRIKAQTATIVSVEECVEAVLKDIDLPEKISKEVVFENKDKLKVFMDFHQLYSVLRNLFLNAIQAMEENGKLTINAFSSNNDSIINIHVRDTGHGIMGEAREKLFNLFYTSKTTGTGLGLAISKSIIEANEGELRLEETNEKGTSFIVRLPSLSGAIKDGQTKSEQNTVS